jgi:predicted cobalt transporter CbtA
MGAPQAEINKAIVTMESQDSYAIGTQLRSLAQGLLFFTVIGLLVGLIMKKKDPNLA